VDIYEEIVALRQQGRKGAVATIVNVRGSIPSFETAKMLVRDDGSIAGTVGGGCVEAEVWQAAREVMESEKPRTLTFNLNQNPKYDTGLVCGGTLDIFIEPVLPPALLYIFGAGHVAFNLYKTAKNAGFDVTVIDDREAKRRLWLTELERWFPGGPEDPSVALIRVESTAAHWWSEQGEGTADLRIESE